MAGEHRRSGILLFSVAKKHRVRARSRRAVEAARRASSSRAAQPARPAVPEHEPARASAPRQLRYGARSGTARAIGAPSAALERAAGAERAFVARDFRRIAIVLAITVALLAVSGIVLNIFER